MGDSLKFGTSGLRGLADDFRDGAGERYARAFLMHLRAEERLGSNGKLFVARDLRASSGDIARSVMAAAAAAGLQPVDCGLLPTPALALHAMAMGGPGIMVTGSHIPADRNGLKFFTPQGDITRADEAGILAALDDEEPVGAPMAVADGFAAAGDRYRRRYLRLLPPRSLDGWKVGVFEHSSVARDILVSLLTRAGAEVVRLGRQEEFVAIDTEATADAVFDRPKRWIAQHGLHALVSSDGDGDRPLLMDGAGAFVRGDVLGLLAAQFLGAETVVTPVTANSAIEAVGLFSRVVRTRVGAPEVIAAMAEAVAEGIGHVVGFEASGSVLLGSDFAVGETMLGALLTRDAVLPILAALGLAAARRLSVAELVAEVPVRPALSDRLRDVPFNASAALIADLHDPDFAQAFFAGAGTIERVSSVDGMQFTLAGGNVVHFRASGTAPELRCYVESETAERAATLLKWGLEAAEGAVR